MKMGKISLVVLCVLCMSLRAEAQMKEYKTDDDEARAYDVTRTNKTVDGLHFTVEEDRPIVKVAGVYRPIDFDSYVALKFKKLQEQLTETEGRLKARIDDLTEKLARLTEDVEDLSRQASKEDADKPAPSAEGGAE